ncbi:hypothetical protein HDV00_006498 [Rhizophlyctis rosea]|nr:hypothetical protein HDV00_006498 [Rhizophlyctis rosea]
MLIPTTPKTADKSEEKKDRIYAPNNWDAKEFEGGTGVHAHMVAIAKETETNLYYNKTAHSVEVTGMDLQRVFAARKHLEKLFAPVIYRSERPWDRPHRPGEWGQRRDNLPPTAKNQDSTRNGRKANKEEPVADHDNLDDGASVASTRTTATDSTTYSRRW